MAQPIQYTQRDFVGIRDELLRYTKQYYPDLIQNANDASVFSVFLDLNAAVADNLHYHIDRSIQETVLQYAQQRSSLFNIARTYGLRIPGNRPSVSVAEFSITVPAFGDKEDARYLGILRRGAQVKGGGEVFESVDDINFNSPYNSSGVPNRKKIPNFNANGTLINYTIVKREVIVNGITKIFKRVISSTDIKPFLELFLPEKNVLGVTSIIQKDGTNIQTLPKSSEFLSNVGRWYEVKSLAEDKVFVVDNSKKVDYTGIKPGKYVAVDNRFITEYTPESFFKVTLGGGTSSGQDSLDDFVNEGLKMSLSRHMDNFSLGATPKANTTLFVQYRVGGGSRTNLGPNSINTFGIYDFSVNGPVPNINTTISNSLTVNNITAAVGGAEQPSVEEVRNYITFNFSAQNRAVTLRDYESLIQTMPSHFGAPAKVSVSEIENKIQINLLSYNPDGKLSSKVSSTLMRNVADYLSDYRMLNDYLVLGSAQVLDMGIDVSLIIDPAYNQAEIVTEIITKVDEFFNTDGRELGSNIFTGTLSKDISQIEGVINLTDIEYFSKIGEGYSSSEVSQSYSDVQTRQISLVDGTIFAQPNQIFQVRYPTKDISVRLKPLNQVSIR
tara:strand:+ start:67442 stop:69277 length:1836 start_codon:yes stop_codon:yes gene_type:complete